MELTSVLGVCIIAALLCIVLSQHKPEYSAAVVLIPYLLLTEKGAAVQLHVPALIMVLIVGVVHTGVAYAMYFGSVQKLPAQTVAVLSYIDPIVAMLLAVLILGEPMSLPELLGAGMILGATAASELKQ